MGTATARVYEKLKNRKTWDGHEDSKELYKRKLQKVTELNRSSGRPGGNKSRRKVRKLSIMTQNDHGGPFFPGGGPNYSPKSPKGHVFDTTGRPPVSPRTIKDFTMPWCRGNIY